MIAVFHANGEGMVTGTRLVSLPTFKGWTQRLRIARASSGPDAGWDSFGCRHKQGDR